MFRRFAPLHLVRIALLALLATPACADTDAPAVVDGPPLTIQMAPLTLSGIAYACYDIRVDNDLEQTVWSQGVVGTSRADGDTTTICSDQYGGAGGGVSYIGPCDGSENDGSDGETALNTVTLWLDGLYDTNGDDIGDYQDPCPAGCTIPIPCVENEDRLVIFDLTIVRAAQQGFFDIAVNFDDLFCSAKLDTCRGDDPADATPIELLFHGDSDRDPTSVFGFACTAGPGNGVMTNLLYEDLALACDEGIFVLDPSGEGNAYVTQNGVTVEYAVYRGTEQLDCGPTPCNKAFWNLAINLVGVAASGEVALTNCSLAFQATASGGTSFVDGALIGDNVVYPFIDVDVTLTDDAGAAICQQNPLDGTDPLNGDAPSKVKTVYQGSLSGVPAARTMCAAFDGTTVTDTDGCCGCPADYTPTADGSSCVQQITVPATPPTTEYDVCSGSDFAFLTREGAIFTNTFADLSTYEVNEAPVATASSTCPLDDSDPDCKREIDGWYTGDSEGYLGYVGVWACQAPGATGEALPVDEFIGFSSCFTLPETATYMIGLAGDNLVKLSIDGQSIYEAQSNGNFFGWNVSRVQLSAGTHIIELFGLNAALPDSADPNPAAFGAEIYGPFDAADVDTPQKMAAALNVTRDNGQNPQIDPPSLVLFSTRDLLPADEAQPTATFDVSDDGTSGYTCPTDYVFNRCADVPACTFQDVQSCQGE